MPHDVFISHSSHDRPVAEAICDRLETAGVRCWIAPRDILPGDTYAGAIMRAITDATIMLVVFSERANRSPQILREVERAVAREVAVLPVRIDDAKPSDELEYFISTPHWLDALPPPPEQHLDRVTSVVQRVLAARRERSRTPPPAPQPQPRSAVEPEPQPQSQSQPQPQPGLQPREPESQPECEPQPEPPRKEPPPAATDVRRVVSPLARPAKPAKRRPKSRNTSETPESTEEQFVRAVLGTLFIGMVFFGLMSLWMTLMNREGGSVEGFADTETYVSAGMDTMPPSTLPLPGPGFMDPNTAPREELMTVPGITYELANALVAGRPFADMRGVDSILRSGLGEEQRDTVYNRLWRPLDLNTATSEEIELIPGVGPRMRQEFEWNRPYKSIEQFRREIGKYVNAAEVARLERYVTLGF